jgi:hypothetical protein
LYMCGDMATYPTPGLHSKTCPDRPI